MTTLNIRVHDALTVCQCGVQGSFSGDVGNLQDKSCYRCQAVGRFVGTILRGHFRDLVFWDHRDKTAFAWFEALYRLRMERLQKSRIDRAFHFDETIREAEEDVRSRLLMLNAVSQVLKKEIDCRGESVVTRQLRTDLSCAAELLAKAQFNLEGQRTEFRFFDLTDVLLEDEAVKWQHPGQNCWKTGTLVEIQRSKATIVVSDAHHCRIVLPLVCVVRVNADK